MRMFEFQGKSLLAEAGIPIPRGEVARSPEEAASIAATLGGQVVVKAQVLAGARGKSGGVRFASSPSEARDAASLILALRIRDLPVEAVLVEERLAISSELYAGITVDRSRRCPVAIFCPAGGMDIEEVAATAPERITKRWIDVARGFPRYEAMNMLLDAGLRGRELVSIATILERLYRLYCRVDAEMLEINPLVVCADGDLKAADARLVVDDNAMPRHPELPRNAMPATSLEARARDLGLTYVELDGDICVLANGAGLTMTTMDAVAAYGGRPANFLEVGGGAYVKARAALSIALAHPGLKALLVNIFGAFARTDVIADGVTAALAELKPDLPIVVRVMGTGEDRAREYVRERLGLEPLADMDEAARQVVALAYGRGTDGRAGGI